MDARPKVTFPIISVVIPSYNAGDRIVDAIQSIKGQEEGIIELIIIDAGSTDTTLQVINEQNNFIDYWQSEPDKGIYDAMNKGIAKASGEWLYFLGADDILKDNVINQLKNYLDSKYALIYGDVLSESGATINSYLNWRTFLQNTLHHQGAFYRKNIFEQYRYDTDLRILSDYELNLKIYVNNLPVKKVPFIIATCGDKGASSDLNMSLKETNIVRSKVIGNGILNKLLSLLLRIYYAQKKLRTYIYKKYLFIKIL